MKQQTQISAFGVQPAVERRANVWHGIIQPNFLKQPVWLVLAIIGTT
jgi:hypothetical protein